MLEQSTLFESGIWCQVQPFCRLKGFLAVVGKDMRHVIQAVGARVAGYYDRPWKAGEARSGQLVVIGLKGLDRAAITAGIVG